MLKPKRKRMSFQQNMMMDPLSCYEMEGKKGRFGVELELEGGPWPDKSMTPGWTPHQDGSLRDGGIEFALSSPHNLEGVEDRVNALNSVFESFGSNIRLSHRASTHIHFNVQREKYIYILGMIILFTMIEPVFLRMCGDERDGNLFCLPSYDTGEIHLHFEQLLQHLSNGPINSAFPPRGKYASLNINPLNTLGSLEFRTFPATIQAYKVITWCQWIENIYKMVRHETDLTFHDLYLRLKHNPEVVTEIFGRTPFSPNQLHEMVTMGCYQGHELRRLLAQYMRGYTGEE